MNAETSTTAPLGEMGFSGPAKPTLLQVHGWLLLIAASFLMDACVSMANLGVQYLGVHRLAAPNLVLGLFAASFSCAYAFCCMGSGVISDRLGRRGTALSACVCCMAIWSVLPLLGSWLWILVLMPFAGAALSLFWPSIQAWLAELTIGRSGGLRRSVGLFNIAFCSGLMLGPLATGWLWPLDYRLTLWAPAGLLLLLLILLCVTPRDALAGGTPPGVGEVEHEPGPTPEQVRRFMWLGWVGNFASWFAAGALLALFPKLGAGLGFDTRIVSLILSAFRVGQVGLVVWAMHSRSWQYRLAPLLLLQGVAAVAFFAGCFVRTPAAFSVVFILGGLAAGLTYASSLFYSLANREGGRGRKSGLHEAVLGSGAFLGPLAGGLAAQYWGLRAPFIVSALVLAVASLFQLRLHAGLVTLSGSASELPVSALQGASRDPNQES